MEQPGAGRRQDGDSNRSALGAAGVTLEAARDGPNKQVAAARGPSQSELTLTLGLGQISKGTGNHHPVAGVRNGGTR